jgi:phosphate uptake regulator
VVNPILEARLETLRRTLNELSAAVDDNLRAVLSLLTCDSTTTNVSLKSISGLARQARESCLLLLAKEHPLANDLKFAMSALRVGHDYERIQELAEALQKRITVLRKSAFKDICQEMTGVMADILSMHEIVRVVWRRNKPETDEKMLQAQQEKLSADIQVSILNIQSRIMNSIAAQNGEPEMVVEVVLACRHLERIAGLLVAIPGELHSFG